MLDMTSVFVSSIQSLPGVVVSVHHFFSLREPKYTLSMLATSALEG